MFAYLLLITGLALSSRLIFGKALFDSAEQTRSGISTSLAEIERNPSDQMAVKASTRPIESIRVGQRVLASNPEIDDQQRNQWRDPAWNEWLHLSLKLPIGDSSDTQPADVLNIEILRPESWFIEQVGFVFEPSVIPVPPPAEEALLDFDAAIDAPVPFAPLQSWERLIESVGSEMENSGVELLGLTVEMDLPEMGAVGTAVVSDIQPCPIAVNGAGQVVTATFSHPPTSKVLDVLLEKESKPIGVTENHPFWSVDRNQFVPIGQMSIGEQVLSYHGLPRRIESMLARPGPQIVYNIEVYGEHVYYVGDQGVLVHNAYLTKAIKHSKGHFGTHLDRTGKLVRRTARTGLAGDHVLPKQVIKMALKKAGVKPNSKLWREVIDFQDSAKNLRLMDTRANSSKGARMALDWMKTPIGSKMPRKFIRKMLSKQYTNAQEINQMLNRNRTGPAIDYFADFFGR